MQIDLRQKGELLTFLEKEDLKFQKELDSPTARKQKLLNLLSARRSKRNQNNVIEEGVVDDIKMDNVTSFTTNIPVYQIFEIESDDEEVDEKSLPGSALTYDD